MSKCLRILFIITLTLLHAGHDLPTVLAATSHSRLCKAETGHCSHGRMREFWSRMEVCLSSGSLLPRRRWK